MSWKYFAGSAFLVGCALWKAGVPILPVALGISLAALWNLRKRAKLASSQQGLTQTR